MKRTTLIVVVTLMGFGLSFLLGIQFGGGRRTASGEPYEDPPAPTAPVRIVNRCGALVTTQDGVPVTVELPLVPPPLDEQSLGAVSEPPLVDGELPPIPVAARPPYVKAYAETC